MLTFNHVTFKYEEEKFNIIDDLSFKVDTGDFVSIIGVSGCGKSTVFRLLNRLLEPSGGDISIDGKDIRGTKNYAGYMPQKDMLFPWRTIEKNLCLPMEIQKLPKEKQLKEAGELLRQMGLDNYRKKYPKDLSGGMRQRISFARTLLTHADLLLLDEPFSALDALTRLSMQEWLMEQWQRLHKTVLFITHDVEEAIFLSKKIYVVPESPIRRLEVVDVPLPYPRKREYLDEPDMIALKETLIRQLREQVKVK